MKTFKILTTEILNKIHSGYLQGCNRFSQAIHDNAFLKCENLLKTRNPQCRFLFQIDNNEKNNCKKMVEQSQSIFKELCSAAIDLVRITSEDIKINL